MSRSLFILTLMLISLNAIFLSGSESFESHLPSPRGVVTDLAHALDQQTSTALEKIINEVEMKTSAEIAVVTLPSLNGAPISDVSHAIFNQWKIGKKNRNNGLLVAIVPTKGSMRIEVGYGLEPIITDGISGRLIREKFSPFFSKGDIRGGILNGVEAIAEIIIKDEEMNAPSAKKRLLVFMFIWIANGFFILGGAWGDNAAISAIFGAFLGIYPLYLSGILHEFNFMNILALYGTAFITAGFGYVIGARQSRIFRLEKRK